MHCFLTTCDVHTVSYGSSVSWAFSLNGSVPMTNDRKAAFTTTTAASWIEAISDAPYWFGMSFALVGSLVYAC